MSEASKAVFLSYASQDAEAARKLCETLRAAGVEVWFDTDGGLEHGDEWDAKIRRQIKECVLFIAIVSANTQAREEGYFRIEWELAAQRALGIASGVAFILPVVIDGTKEPAALVPDRFRSVQWTRLPDGNVPADVLQRFLKLWSHRTGAVKHQSREQGAGSKKHGTQGTELEAGRPRPAASGPKWLRPILASAVIVIAVLAYTLVTRRAPEQAVVPPAVPAPVAPPVSPARELVEKAAQLTAASALSPDGMRSAGEMAERATQLDPMDGDVWAIAAMVDIRCYVLSVDRTEKRQEMARAKVLRAKGLAPGSGHVRLAEARMLAELDLYPDGGLKGEAILRELLQEKPPELDATEVLGCLGIALQRQRRFVEAAQILERAGRENSGWMNAASWAWLLGGKLPEARAAAERQVALDRSTGLLQLCRVEFLREDLDGAQAALDQLPPGMRFDETVATNYCMLAWARREPEAILAAARAMAGDYVQNGMFVGPKHWLTGDAHLMAGRPEAARVEWLKALAVVEQRLAADNTSPRLLRTRLFLLARLGRQEEAAQVGKLLQQLDGELSPMSLLCLGQREEALAKLESQLRGTPELWTHFSARFDPDYDPLRGDPRFEKLLRDHLPKGAKPFDDEKTTDHGPQTTQASGPRPQTPDPGPADRPQVDQKSVAVLAFANLSDDKANEYFSDGISEELLNVLAKIPGLKVAARTSAFYFKGKEIPIPEIAKQLGVAYVVEGSVRKSGDKVRITAQLIKAADGFHVWSDTFTRDIKDVFAVQDEIAGLIAKNLELKMGIGETVARQAVSPEAYQEYLLGRAAAAKAGMMDLRAAVTHFERAVALEPKYTAAWVQLATTHTQLGRWGGAPTLQSWASARAAVDQAVALEPDSPNVLLALGWIQRTGEWDWKGAEKSFRRALALQPNQPEILAGTAVLLYNVGQKEEAFRLAGRAIQLDPLNAASQIDLSIMYYENNNWAEAEQAARRALQLAPGGTSYHSILAWNLIRQGRYAEAEVEIAQDADRVEQSAAYGLLAIARGEGAKTREMLDRLEAVARTQGDIADVQQCIAWLYTGLGEKDHAFAALEKARATRDPSMSWLRNTSELKALSSDPRWDALLHQVGLADEQLK